MASCSTKALKEAVDSSVVSLVAHRGASHDAPENTLAAFRLAWDQGADGIEGDFFLTEDGEIVCTHDKTTKRFTGGGIDLPVAASSLEALQALDVGSWKDPRWAGERMPTLEDVLAIVPPGKRFLIEIKCGLEIMPALTETLQDSPTPHEQLRIICFDAEVVKACREALPTIKAYWLTSFNETPKGSGRFAPSVEEILTTLKACDANGLDAQAHDVVGEALVTSLPDHGYEFHAWTVDDAQVARRMIALGVDSLTTNQPATLRQALEVAE